MHSCFTFLGRIMMSSLFLIGAYWHITHWEISLTKIGATGFLYPNALLIFATLLMVMGGVSLLLGFWTSLGAILLIINILLTAFIFYPFWTLTGEEMQLSLLMFLVRIGLCGGLLFLLASGPGFISIDFHLRKRRITSQQNQL